MVGNLFLVINLVLHVKKTNDLSLSHLYTRAGAGGCYDQHIIECSFYPWELLNHVGQCESVPNVPASADECKRR